MDQAESIGEGSPFSNIGLPEQRWRDPISLRGRQLSSLSCNAPEFEHLSADGRHMLDAIEA